jgi:hypothetical protein
MKSNFMSKYVSAIIWGFLLVIAIYFDNYIWNRLWFFQYIVYFILGFGCLSTLLNSVKNRNWISLIIIIASGLLSSLFYLLETELVIIEPILKAKLTDDLSGIDLILREDQTFELKSYSFIGTHENFSGDYLLDSNKIIFLDRPYDSDFIPDTIYIYENKIVLNHVLSKPDTSFASYFDIRLNNTNESR